MIGFLCSLGFFFGFIALVKGDLKLLKIKNRKSGFAIIIICAAVLGFTNAEGSQKLPQQIQKPIQTTQTSTQPSNTPAHPPVVPTETKSKPVQTTITNPAPKKSGLK